MNPAQLTVVVPAFNEAGSIAHLLGKLLHLQYEGTARILVVDDGSTDGTPAILDEFAARGVEIITHPENQGLHASILTGLKDAVAGSTPEGTVVVMDADNTHDPAAIPRMLDKLNAGYDVVIASRFVDGGRMIGAPPMRRLYSSLARRLLTLRFPRAGVSDFTCGYRAYRTSLLQRGFQIFGDDLLSRESFACTLEMLLKLRQIGARVGEVPLVLRYDLKTDASKLQAFRTIRDSLAILVRTANL